MSKRIIYLITIILLFLFIGVATITYINMAFDMKYEDIGIEHAMNQMENEVDEELLAEYRSIQTLHYLLIAIVSAVYISALSFTLYLSHYKRKKDLLK